MLSQLTVPFRRNWRQGAPSPSIFISAGQKGEAARNEEFRNGPSTIISAGLGERRRAAAAAGARWPMRSTAAINPPAQQNRHVVIKWNRLRPGSRPAVPRPLARQTVGGGNATSPPTGAAVGHQSTPRECVFDVGVSAKSSVTWCHARIIDWSGRRARFFTLLPANGCSRAWFACSEEEKRLCRRPITR